MADDRLRRGIRDLAALTALPSLCVGRTPEEALDIVAEALPNALSCDLVYLTLPEHERGSLDGAALSPDELAHARAVTAADTDGAEAVIRFGGDEMWCVTAEVPLGARRGRLIAGKRARFDADTDRVLIRTAANLVGTIVQSANILDAARRKDDFLAMLGHELRNPLAPIVTAVDLLRLNPSAARECDVIERHGQHLVRIVDDLLDISRVTRGHVELRREPVSLAAALQRAVEIARPQLDRKRHHLTVGDAGDTTVEGDPIRLAQVFGNLLTNAAKFTPSGGTVDVLVERGRDRVSVRVRDTGVGIAADQLQRIFEPFVQADRERDELQGGLGLGLAIVRNLVERHGGAIAVHSDGRGRGSTFTVELPTVVPVAAAVPVAAPQPANARAQIRVLVVDDNHDIAELMSDALQSKGFLTAIANDGNDALASWRSFMPHAGVFDLGLPGLDGYEVARTVRAEYGPAATLIAVSGYGQPKDRTRAAEAGFDCHMVKPVKVDELVRVLDLRVVG